MKKFLKIAVLSLLIGVAVPVAYVACTTPQQRVAFNTIATVEQSTTAAVQGYFFLVAKGEVATNGVPSVSASYNKFQAGVIVALDLVENNTNALAPSSLIQLSSDTISLVNKLKGAK